MISDVLADRLRARFPAKAIRWYVTRVEEQDGGQGFRARVVPGLRTEAIQDRLDEVLGVANWNDDVMPQPDGSVVCELSIRGGGEWVNKRGSGGPFTQRSPAKNRRMAIQLAFWDAAQHFGVGRYLANVPSTRVSYDPDTYELLTTPDIPAEFLPGAPASGDSGITQKPGSNLARLLINHDLWGWHGRYWDLGELTSFVLGQLARKGLVKGNLDDWSEDTTGYALAEMQRFEQQRMAHLQQVAEEAATLPTGTGR